MDEAQLGMLAGLALPSLPTLAVCVAGLAYAASRSGRADATSIAVVLIALVAEIVLTLGGVATTYWMTTAIRDGAQASRVGVISGMLFIPRVVLSAGVLGALVWAALRKEPAPPRA